MSSTKEDVDTQHMHETTPIKPFEDAAGAAATVEDAKASLGKAIRGSPKMFLFTLGLASYKLLFGIETVSIGTISTVPMFRKVFGEFYGGKWIIPAEWVSIWAASNPVGMMIGSMIGGWAQDRCGRRKTIQVAIVLQIGTIVICYLADTLETDLARRAMYFVGKLVQGLTLSAGICVAQTYVSEVLPTQLRGPILATLSVFMLLGQLLGSIIVRTKVHSEDASAYRIPIASQWVFSAIPLLVAVVIPESPAWLMRRERWDDAQKACLSLVGSGKTEMAEQTYQRIRMVIQHERANAASEEHASYLDCFRGVDRRRTLIVCFANTIAQLFGLAVLGHSSYFLVLMGMTSSTATTILIGGIIIGIVCNMLIFWILGKVGRRKLLLVSLGAVTLLWASMGIAGCFDGPAVQWYFAVSMMMIIACAGLGAWPTSHVVAGETSSITLRAKTQGIGAFTDGLATGVFATGYPFIYSTDAGNLGGKTGFVVAGFTAIAFLGCYFYVPEMMGRPAVEVDEMFELKLKANDFSKWSSGEGRRV